MSDGNKAWPHAAEIGLGFEFAFAGGAFDVEFEGDEGGGPHAPSRGLTEDELGWELTRGGLKHPGLEALFPRLALTLFPLAETSLQSACLVHNVLGLSKPRGAFDKVFIDWPREARPLLPALLKSIPRCVAALGPDAVERLAFSGGGLSPEDQLASPSPNLAYHFESLDVRRLALEALLRRGHVRGLEDVETCGGAHASLQWAMLPRVQAALRACPPEWMIPSGLLLFLQGRMGIARRLFEEGRTRSGLHPHESPHPLGHLETAARGLLDSLADLDGGRVLIVADPLLLAALALQARNRDRDRAPAAPGVTRLADARIARSGALRLCRLSEANDAEHAHVTGFLSRAFLEATAHGQPVAWMPLLRTALVATFKQVSAKYEDWTKLRISVAQERDFFRFAYRLAAEERLLFPKTFDLMLAARSVIDGNFAYEMLLACRTFPGSETEDALTRSLPIVEVPMKELAARVTTLSLSAFETVQRHRPRPSLRGVRTARAEPSPRAPVPESKYADNAWAFTDHPYSCSFPDEDIFMEDFAFQTRAQAKEFVKAREAHVRELQCSLLDGLDLRETVRHWHAGKIMVREELNSGRADVGSIVFNFASKEDAHRFSWKSFWLAEQHDNSHLMFYATPYQEALVGPGIAKSAFGGFAVIPLPSYGDNPWADPFIRGISTQPVDALLLAGALATDHRSVLFVSDAPPSARIADLLKRSGKFIIHVRLDELPPDKVRKVKTFHILAEAGVRAYAQKYIRKET